MRGWFAACCAAGVLATVSVNARQTLPGWFDLPVQGGTATLARLGIPADERALTLTLLARALHDREARLTNAPRLVDEPLRAITMPAVAADASHESIDIPAPLDADTWRRLLALPEDADLFARLLSDRDALLLAAALASSDDSIRSLVATDPDLLRSLYLDAAAFLIVARSLTVSDGQIAVAGGGDGRAMWEVLTGVSPSRPSPFIRALVTRDQGRLAWYFDTIASLDEQRLAAAWPPNPGGRAVAARALYEVFRDSDPQWRAREQPFRRAVGDAWTVVTLTDVANGRLIGPSAAPFWRLVFESDRIEPSDARRILAAELTPLTLPELASAIVLQPPRQRRQRFETVRLAQRAFSASSTEDLPALAVALSGYKRFPSLLLALERMRISSPETWQRMVTAARHVSDKADHATESLTSFQAVIALVERLRHVRVLDVETADQLLRRLSDAVQSDSKVSASLVGWLVDVLVPALPPLERPDSRTGSTAYESRLLQAVAGRRDRVARSLEWEGLNYAIDLVAAEQARLRAVRLQIPSPGLDAAIDMVDARALASALTALVYTFSMGHADGAVALSREVATRHDFGFDASSSQQRVTPWAPPEERQGDGPWRVLGSLIGLDAGLSRLTLRRVADEQLPQAPALTLNDFATITRTMVAMVPTELRDDDRDEIAAAIARGRRRVHSALGNRDALLALSRIIRMSAATRQVLPWMMIHDPAAILGCFSLRDLLWLGEPALSRQTLDHWGVAGAALDGRALTVMPLPAPWEDFAGRPGAGQMTTQVPDLTLRLVEETARLRLPAQLVPSLLAYASEDFWHDAQPRFADDWPRMIRQAAAIEATRVEDYVAALVGDGLLRSQ